MERKNLFVTVLLAAGLVFVALVSACPAADEGGSKVTGIALEKKTLLLTVGEKEKLAYTVTPPESSGAEVTWESSAPAVVSVSPDGTVTAVGFGSGGAETDPAAATGTAVITVTTVNGNFQDTVTVNTTIAARVDILALPPLKDQFGRYFMVGNIFNPGDISGSSISNTRLTRHFNALTHENNMKPVSLSSGYNAATNTHLRNQSGFTTAGNMVDAAIAADIKVVGHALLWHNQIPLWQQNMANETKETALKAMKAYISDVVTYFQGKIYSWDVLNEAFPDNAGSAADWKNAIRKGASGEGQGANPWYVAIGSDFVYEGFLAARLADPGAILYYNDYNTDNSTRARLIYDMVAEVNAKYKADFPAADHSGNGTRLLIEGIGMQEHHNTGVQAANIKAALDRFKPLGVIIAVTELDVLAQSSYSQFVGGAAVTNQMLLNQANMYGQYFRLYLDYSDIIERVTMWGVIDSQSWRSGGKPLLFDASGKAKPAYYKAAGALDL